MYIIVVDPRFWFARKRKTKPIVWSSIFLTRVSYSQNSSFSQTLSFESLLVLSITPAAPCPRPLLSIAATLWALNPSGVLKVKASLSIRPWNPESLAARFSVSKLCCFNESVFRWFFLLDLCSSFLVWLCFVWWEPLGKERMAKRYVLLLFMFLLLSYLSWNSWTKSGGCRFPLFCFILLAILSDQLEVGVLYVNFSYPKFYMGLLKIRYAYKLAFDKPRTKVSVFTFFFERLLILAQVFLSSVEQRCGLIPGLKSFKDWAWFFFFNLGFDVFLFILKYCFNFVDYNLFSGDLPFLGLSSYFSLWAGLSVSINFGPYVYLQYIYHFSQERSIFYNVTPLN